MIDSSSVDPWIQRFGYGAFLIVKLLIGMMYVRWSLLLAIHQMVRLVLDNMCSPSIADKRPIYIRYTCSISSRNFVDLLISEGCTSWFTQGELPFVQYIWYEFIKLLSLSVFMCVVRAWFSQGFCTLSINHYICSYFQKINCNKKIKSICRIRRRNLISRKSLVSR